jgi:hypothetical protein
MTVLFGSAAAQAADSTVRFVGDERAVALDFRNGKITIGDQAYPLKSCSDELYYCYESSGADFAIALPKKCPQAPPFWDWSVHGVRTVVVGVVPDTNVFSLISEKHSHFKYDYDTRLGLVELHYDPSGKLFGNDHGWLRLSYDELKKYRLTLVGSEAPFMCAK